MRSSLFLKLAIAMLLAMLAVIGNGLLFLFVSERDDEYLMEVLTAQAVLQQSEALLGSIRDAETGQRGFLLTQDERYLKPHFAGIDKAFGIFLKLHELRTGSDDQTAKLKKLETLTKAKFEELAATIELAKNGDTLAALALVNTHEGRDLMAAIRGELELFRRAEQTRLDDIRDRFDRWQRGVEIVFVAECFLFITALIYFFWFVRRRIIFPLTRLASDAELAGKHKPLAAIPAIKTSDEIGHLARSFYQMYQEVSTRTQELQKTAAVFRNIGDAVIVTDSSGVIVDTNPGFTRTTGFSRMQALGRNVSTMLSERHHADFFEEIRSTLVHEGSWSGEVWTVSADDREYPSRVTVDALSTDDGGLSGYVSVFADITNAKIQEAKLEFIAHHDALTKLPNRSVFMDRLSQGVKRSNRQGTRLAVVFIDIDRFKNINDTLGHDIGDGLLIAVADRLSSVTRDIDTLARLGGDEFCLIMENLESPEQVRKTAQKLISVFAQPFITQGHTLRISTSIGIATHPDNGDHAGDLLRFADTAMYAAKKAGRNSYRFYSKSMSEAFEEQDFIQSEIRNSIAQGHFYLAYQPQVDLRSQRTVGLEVLARWKHPLKGSISPSSFVPVAESSGAIKELGEFILKTACAQGTRWLKQGVHDFDRIWVNVSASQIHDSTFPSIVRRSLVATGYPADRLGLEVTESLAMDESSFVVAPLNELRNLGIKIAIDDFGTGYSSLSYLKSLPVDKIKIDRSFVRDIPQDPNDMAIVDAIIAVGNALNLEVIAEGVETETQEQFLLKHGCVEAQGFRLGKPMSGELITAAASAIVTSGTRLVSANK